MQKLGQHFLNNRAAIEKIVTALSLRTGETALEVGAGHGELTLPLIEACRRAHARVIAVEKDRELFATLREKTAHAKNFELIHSDIRAYLRTDAFKAIAKGPYVITGNLPYYLTNYLLRMVGELENAPRVFICTIQREVAERIVARAPHMNKLAASVQFWAEPKIIARLRPDDFSPPPRVGSATISLESKALPHARANRERYYRAVRTIFKQPRQTTLNNLSRGSAVAREAIESALASLRIDPKSRPQDLSVDDITAISHAIH